MPNITLLTCSKYINPQKDSVLIQNILEERRYLQRALEAKGVTVDCVSWDDPDYDWAQTDAIVIRSVWDYFERYDEFALWLEKVQHQTQLINPYSLVTWNIDKHYLADLEQQGVAIVPTVYIDSGEHRSLTDVCTEHGWKDVVIKPAVSGTAFKTYKVIAAERNTHESLFQELVAERDMLVQPFIKSITSHGEASLILFNGIYTHAIIKKVKQGDYRVQDDFGGTVHHYEPTAKEIAFAKKVFACCDPTPAYGRVDIVWDEDGTILLGELEIIEPELWVRNHPESVVPFAEGILSFL